jgi:thiamine-monophosphate kinase
VIQSAALPLSADLRSAVDAGYPLIEAISGGDDYELCFTAPHSRDREIARIMSATGARATRIGAIAADRGVLCVGPDGRPLPAPRPGYLHFP